jgi:N-dimethylarginine dimethylaminohydrolase
MVSVWRHYLVLGSGYKCTGDTKDGHFEGGGDCVFTDNQTLFAGFGYRTAKDVRL